MLSQCWGCVADDGPTFRQHRVSVLCLLRAQHTGLVLAQREPSQFRRWTSVVLLLGQRCRLWTNCRKKLVQFLYLLERYRLKLLIGGGHYWGQSPSTSLQKTKRWSNAGLKLVQCRRRKANAKPISIQCFVFAWSSVLLGNAPKTRRWIDGGLMLGLRRRHWPNVKPALVRRVVLAGSRRIRCQRKRGCQNLDTINTCPTTPPPPPPYV